MPLFEYRCEACGKSFEKLTFEKIEGPVPCPSCGSEKTVKQFSSFASPSSSGADTCPSAPICPSSGGCCGGSCSGH